MHALVVVGCCGPSLACDGPVLAFVCLCLLALAIMGLCWSLWAFVGLRRPCVGLCVPLLACVGHRGPLLALCVPLLTCVGLCWPSWAFIGRRVPLWPALAVVGRHGPILDLKMKIIF
jgi:hypothetical protein